MFRRLIIEAILFAFPFIAYFGGRALARWLKPGMQLPEYSKHVPHLTILGLILAIGGFVLTWALEPRHVDQAYTPAHIENGEVRPGAFSDPATAPREAPVLTPMQQQARDRENAAANRPPEP